LFERCARTLLNHLPQEHLHGSDLLLELVQFRQLALREPLPPPGSRRFAAKAKKHLSDFVKRESELACPLHNGQPVQNGGIVTPLPADTLRRRKNSNLLVIADG